MKDSRTGNTIKNSGASLLYKLVHIIIKFVMRTAFIHLLGKEYTGISGLFTDILTVLSLMELGLDGSMVYALYGPLARKDEKRVSALMGFYRTAFHVIGVVVLLAGLACTPFLGYIVKGVPNIKEDIRLIFMMYVVTSASSYFLVYKTILLRANQQSRIIAKWSTIISIAECVLEVVLLLIFREFFLYLAVHLVATVVRNLIVTQTSVKMYPQYFAAGEKIGPQERRKLFRDLACICVYNLSGVVINSTDSIFISAFIGTVTVAVIGNFTLIISSVRTLVSQIVSATKPSIGNLVATTSANKQEQVFRRMNFIAFWVGCFCTTCLFALLNPFVGDIWFDASYKVSTGIIAVLAANFYIAVMVFPVESFRGANGLFVQGWFRPAAMALMNIVLDFALGKLWGIFGIFIATTISRLSTQVWFDPYLIHKRVFNKSVMPYYWDYLIKAAITAASCAIAFLIGQAVPIANVYGSFIIRAVVAVIVPNALVFAIYHRTEEFAYLKSLGMKALRKVKRK